MLFSLYLLSCNNPQDGSQTPGEVNRDITLKTCGADTLESGVMCTSVGDYTVLEYSYVSPSTVKKYAYDNMGRKVFEEGVTYAGGYSFAAWDYDEDERPKAIYLSNSCGPGDHEAVDNDDGLPMLVSKLTGCALTDPDVETFIFDYHPPGHIRRVHDPDNNHEIACPIGGEITFRVYQMDGEDLSELVGNDAINIEFRVTEPHDGSWTETLYLGYRQAAQWVHQI